MDLEMESQAEEPPPNKKVQWYEVLIRRILNVIIGDSRSVVCNAKKCIYSSLDYAPANLRLDPRRS